MSSAGFGFAPDDQEALTALQRKQAYARALLQGGQSDPGNTAFAGIANAGKSILGAILANKADTQEKDLTKAATDRQTQAMAQFLRGASGIQDPSQSQPPAMPSVPGGANAIAPQISNAPGAGPQMPSALQPPSANPAQQSQPQPQGQPPMGAPQQMANPMPPPQGGQQQAASQPMMPQGQQNSPMQALLASKNPYLMQQFGPDLLNRQLDAQQHKMTPLSPQEVDQLGFRKGSVVYRDGLGQIHVEQQSDLKSPEAIQQEQSQARFTNQLPMTSAQKAQNQLGYAQLDKPVSVGFGESLVSPKDGNVIFQGQSDPAAIEQMVDWSIAHGGQYPPNARSPAIASAFNAAMADRLKKTGQTNDQLVDKGIGLRARGAAAYQTGKQQAGTQINEDTVNGGMNILNGLLKKGAAGPTNITGLNDLAVWAKQHTNDPDAANLVNAIGTVSNEYARVMTGNTGSGGSSDAARNEAAQRILKGYNAGTMQQVMGQLHYEMRQRSDAQKGALNQLTGNQYGGVSSSINYADPTVQQPAQGLPPGWSVKQK